ncbi:hypothetical protein ACUSIJ_17805 [Pseudochelatococcus sp. B33]
MARRRTESDPCPLEFIREGNWLKPATNFDAEMIARYPHGSRLIVSVTQPKDAVLMRRFHMLNKKVADALGEDPDILKRKFKRAVGYVIDVTYFDGTIAQEPLSLADLDNAGLIAFVQQVEEIVTTQLCPGSTIREIMDGEFGDWALT